MRIRYDDRIEVRHDRSLWKDVLVGVAAGVVGTAAMGRFWAVVSRVQPGGDGGDGDEGGEEPGALDDISVVGPYHRKEESATETAARVLHRRVRGREPGEELRATLATRLHWATGMTLGAVYGTLRGRIEGVDAAGGALFGAGAWLTNDELLVPLLGLSEGPTAHGADEHLQALGAHVVYGVATAAAASVLHRVV